MDQSLRSGFGHFSQESPLFLLTQEDNWSLYSQTDEALLTIYLYVLWEITVVAYQIT